MFFAKPYFEINSTGLVLKNQPVPKGSVKLDDIPNKDRAYIDWGGRNPLIGKIVNKLGIKNLLLQTTKYQPLPEYDNPQNPSWLMMKDILKQWKEEITCPAIVFLIPLYHYIEEISDASNYQARFTNLTQELGIPLVDPLYYMQSHPLTERQSFRFKTDPHPTAKGHKVLAEALIPAVQNIIENLEKK